jgi:protein phosphatase PTC2/3
VIRSSENEQPNVALGPHRVFPGRLSVSRTIGDIEAKRTLYDGNPRVVIPEPDVVVFDLRKTQPDFLVIGCDGIFDNMDSKDLIHTIWQATLGHSLK